MINPRGTRRRLALTVLAVFAILGVFVVRLVDIQVVRAEQLTEQAVDHRTREVTVHGTRGSIVDRNGVVLADSVERYDITASPVHVDFDTTWITREGERAEVPTAQAIAEIAEITDADPATLTLALTQALAENPAANFAYLVRNVTLDVFEQVRALGIGWVYSELSPARSYPNGAVAGNLIGFIGADVENPLAGVERYMDGCLAATNGTRIYEAGADGTPLPGSVVTTREPADGGTVRLTIDSDLQWFAQEAVAAQAEKLGAEWATGFVVRVSDGHIMAAADWPSVDPNDLDALPADDMGARSFTSPYEPGSIIKPFTFASLVDAGVLDYGERLRVPGQYSEGLPPGRVISDAWWHDEMRLTAAGVLVASSNVGTSMLAARLDSAQRRDYFLGFGFDEPTAVGFLGEESGRVLELEELDSITNVTQQFGQGMSATSAQIASAYQALGNGGVHMPLTLVEGCEGPGGPDGTGPDGTGPDIVGPDGTGPSGASKEATGTRVVSEHAADATVHVMEQLLTQGSLSGVVSIPGYRVAAKTGTAEVAENGVYGEGRIISIAGLVPADDPEYVVVVTIAEPATMKASASVAPAFEAIVEQVIKTFRIEPSAGKSPSIPLTW